MPSRKFWLFRTSRAREASLEKTLLEKRPGKRIQQQPPLFMVELAWEVRKNQFSGYLTAINSTYN
jgi:hypothetical protein